MEVTALKMLQYMSLKLKRNVNENDHEISYFDVSFKEIYCCDNRTN